MLGSPDSALVILSPSDSLDTAIEQVRQVEAPQVSLLIADGNRTLQSMGACEKLRQAAQKAGKSITIYSSDEKTCDAAQLCKLPVVRIEASVPGPTRGQRPPTERLSPAGAPAQRSGAAPAHRAGSADDAFFAALDGVPAAGGTSAPRGIRDIGSKEQNIFQDDLDEDWASALDEFSHVAIGEQDARRQGSDEWATAFDDLSEAMNAGSTGGAAGWEQPRTRIRPEDIELTDEDRERQLPRRQRRVESRPGLLASVVGLIAGLRRRGSAAGIGDEFESAPTSVVARPELSEQEQEERAEQRRRLNLIPIAVLLGTLLSVVLVLLLSREDPSVTIRVVPPSSASNRTISNIPISYESFDAQPISITAEFAMTGQVQGETLMPVTQARGVVQIANQLTQPINLIKGQTMVVGVNPAGQEVRFSVDADVTVPAAQQTFAGFTFGLMDVPVVAVAGGEAYNLPENSPLRVEGFEGALNARNIAPITGGTSQPIKVVTTEDINRLLGQALPQLAGLGLTRLQEQVDAKGMALAGNTFTPTLDVLANDPGSYEVSTIPPSGQPVETGEFTLVVRSTFMALAVPHDTDVKERARKAVEEYLRTTDHEIDPDQYQLNEPAITFDGQRVIASVEATPKGGALSEQMKKDIARAIAGRPHEVAQGILEQLVQRGYIGGYELPDDREVFPPPAEIAVEEVE
ncbi:MAG: hypothetical protein KatS3mg057_3076 [Herpetosiphonaceae bacterium]|nr:MAG: hypothetical protein KatS3mg057_3076 [Herpetosiphonaceae bacterium]